VDKRSRRIERPIGLLFLGDDDFSNWLAQATSRRHWCLVARNVRLGWVVPDRRNQGIKIVVCGDACECRHADLGDAEASLAVGAHWRRRAEGDGMTLLSR
jgi:hypothetical protein